MTGRVCQWYMVLLQHNTLMVLQLQLSAVQQMCKDACFSVVQLTTATSIRLKLRNQLATSCCQQEDKQAGRQYNQACKQAYINRTYIQRVCVEQQQSSDHQYKYCISILFSSGVYHQCPLLRLAFCARALGEGVFDNKLHRLASDKSHALLHIQKASHGLHCRHLYLSYKCI